MSSDSKVSDAPSEIIDESITTFSKPKKSKVKEIISKPSDKIFEDKAKGITILKTNDYRPEKGKTYFSKLPGQTSKRKGIAGVMPCYNEECDGVEVTLASINMARNFLQKQKPEWNDLPFSMCIVLDGWVKASKSMKEYCKCLYPAKINGEYWWNYFDEFQEDFSDETSNATFVFQYKDHAQVNFTPQEYFKDAPMTMDITLVIKVNNRRKHNSHEWFLGHSGYGEAVNADYLFLTDANTLFSDTCLYHLVDALDRDPNLCSATGRQRLMTREQQGTDESMFSLAFILRMIQLNDFEGAIALYYGAFALAGFLPVIPGPCGVYRAEYVLMDSARDWYFETVNKEPADMDLILANLRIAEDRLLSYAPILKGVGTTRMKFVSLAVFYFEAELDLAQFLYQRRRWINGTVMGYAHMLRFVLEYFLCCFFSKKSENYELLEWKASPFRKIYVVFLMLCQALTYMMVAFAPGISIRIIYFGLAYFNDYYDVFPNDELKIVVGSVLGALYLAHIWLHFNNRFVGPIWTALIIQSIMTSVIGIASLIHYTFWYEQQTIYSVIFSDSRTVYLGALTILGPFILAFLLSGKGHSLMYMIKSFIPYLIFMPLVVTFFSSYAFSRLWDLSWGNRPANEMNSVEKDLREKITNKFKNNTLRIMFLLVCLNVIIFIVDLKIQIVIMETYFVITLIQVFFSLIYILLQYPQKINYACGRLCSRCCCK